MAKSKKVKVDFSDVGNIPAGEYEATVESVSEEVSKASGKPTLKWTFTVDVNGSERKVFYNTSLQPQALFKLRELLEALGLEVDGEMELDLADYPGLTLGIKIDQEEWEGKSRDRIVAVMPLESEEDDDEEEVKPAKKKVSIEDDDEEEVKPKNKRKSR